MTRNSLYQCGRARTHIAAIRESRVIVSFVSLSAAPENQEFMPVYSRMSRHMRH
jgi:hypothetical protein